MIKKKGIKSSENFLRKRKRKRELKFSYKKNFEEYQESKLTKKYKIPSSYLSELKNNSNNSNTYKNALINLEYYITYLVKQYHVVDILIFYMAKFKFKFIKYANNLLL